jgi:hypothetical protein
LAGTATAIVGVLVNLPAPVDAAPLKYLTAGAAAGMASG